MGRTGLFCALLFLTCFALACSNDFEVTNGPASAVDAGSEISEPVPAETGGGIIDGSSDQPDAPPQEASDSQTDALLDAVESDAAQDSSLDTPDEPGDDGSSEPEAAACAVGVTSCEGVCVDTQTDPNHCGSCNHACATGRVCSGGVCACPVGTQECLGLCVDTATSELHCGTCGNACTGGRVCFDGACSCPPDSTLCNFTCVDTASSMYHCGGCGILCTYPKQCLQGVCS